MSLIQRIEPVQRTQTTKNSTQDPKKKYQRQPVLGHQASSKASFKQAMYEAFVSKKTSK